MTKAVKSLQLTPQPQAVVVVGVVARWTSTDQCPSLQGPPIEDVSYIGNNRQGFKHGNQYSNQQNWRSLHGNWN